jgi:hypothetical protein
MSNHHRAIGVKDKDHGDHSETSLYDREGTSKKCKPDDAAITRSGSYRYSIVASFEDLLRFSRICYAYTIDSEQRIPTASVSYDARSFV